MRVGARNLFCDFREKTKSALSSTNFVCSGSSVTTINVLWNAWIYGPRRDGSILRSVSLRAASVLSVKA